jgi:hypothetical protein
MTKTLAFLAAFVLLSACAGVEPSDQPISTIAAADSCGPTTSSTLFR